MTLLTESSDTSYAGLLGQDTFAYSFRVDNKPDMNIALDSVPVAQGDFTITGLGNASGGNIILVTPLVVDAEVVLSRVVPITQEVDYQPFDAFPSDTHEGALDKLTMITQQNASSALRSLRFPSGDNADPVLPDVITRRNKFIACDGNGDITVLDSSTADPNSVQKPVGAVIANNFMLFDANKNAVDNNVNIASLIDIMHPIGEIMEFTTAASDPNVIYAGTTWLSLPEGQMLISQGAMYPAASTGGSKDAVVVQHNHGGVTTGTGGHDHLIPVKSTDAFGTGNPQGADDINTDGNIPTRDTGNHSHTLANDGVSGIDQNLPPYLSVFRWERTA